MASCYIYVIARDFGFAPNPFHGVCTLATCKPGIRRMASVGDWIVGMGGSRLKATGRCVFAMQVDGACTFDQYSVDPAFRDKRPVRNGSSKMMVGDNIYRRDQDAGEWVQADSHHSNVDGTQNQDNVGHDTQTNRVLFSHHFYYFGQSAPEVPNAILDELGYTNGRNYRKFTLSKAEGLTSWLSDNYGTEIGTVLGDPFEFDDSERRYSAKDDKIR